MNFGSVDVVAAVVAAAALLRRTILYGQTNRWTPSILFRCVQSNDGRIQTNAKTYTWRPHIYSYYAVTGCWPVYGPRPIYQIRKQSARVCVCGRRRVCVCCVHRYLHNQSNSHQKTILIIICVTAWVCVLCVCVSQVACVVDQRPVQFRPHLRGICSFVRLLVHFRRHRVIVGSLIFDVLSMCVC